MKYRKRSLQSLLQASQDFLDNPEDEAKWLVFQKALQSVEAAEKAESLAEQPENLRNPETRQLLRRYYEEDFKLRNRLLLRVTSLAAIILLLGFLGLALSNNNGPILAFGLGIQRIFGVATPTPTATLTLTPVSTATFTPSATPNATRTPTATATSSATSSPTSTPTATLTLSPSPAPTATHTPQPSRTPSATPTIIPMLTTESITGNLTSDLPAQRHVYRGQLGDIITIRLDSDDFDPYLSLQNSDGEEIASNDDCGSLRRACIGPIVLPDEDVYVIIVDSYTRQGTGAYTLDVDLTSRANCIAELPRVIVTTHESMVNLRNGPGQSYATISPIYQGECFTVIGRNSNNSWLQIRIPSRRAGWILANLTQLQGELDTVPIVDG